MRKIEFDTVNGVFEVESFDEDTDIVDCGDVFFAMKSEFVGTRGSVVDIKTFRTIDEGYGIKKLMPTARETGRMGGSSKSDAKKRAAAENGKKGGRPKKIIAEA